MRNRSSDCRALLALLAAVALLGVFGARPGHAQTAATTFGETIDVRVINVEVVVTDQEGRRVTGLGPGDFRLQVAGRERPIDYFTEVRDGRVVDAEQQGIPAATGLEAGQSVGTRYLVFIDELLTLGRDRDRLVSGVRHDLANLGPADRVAVVAFDGRKLELLTGWNGSHDELDQIFAAALERPTHGLQAEVRRKEILSDRGRGGLQRSPYVRSSGVAPPPGAGNRFGRATPAQEEWARQLSRWLEAEVAAVSAALRSFSSTPGRKVALLLAGKWPFDPVESVLKGIRLPSDELGLARGEELYGALADTANLMGFTLYPADVAGVVGAGSPLRGYDAPTTFAHLASETGGKPMLDLRNGSALAHVVEDTRTYYWIGFTAERALDDTSRTIEVVPLRPGLEVRSRQGYLDLSREAEASAATESLLLFEEGAGIVAEPLPLRPGDARKADRRTFELELTLGIPTARITMLPSGDLWVGDLELRVATLDVKGDRSEMAVLPLHLESKTEPSTNGLVRYDTALTLRRIKQEVVVSVFDPLSGNLLASRVRIDPDAVLD